jgi:hypothetical protein
VDNFARFPLDILYARVDTTYIRNSTENGANETYSSDNWGTPEHENWRTRIYGPQRNLHPIGCKCADCQRGIKWTNDYLKFIARVDRSR